MILMVLMCVRLQRSLGKSNEVIVASSSIQKNLVTESVQQYNYVPQEEGVFSFIFINDTLLDAYKFHHAILIYGTLSDDYIQIMLDEEARLQTEIDTFILFKKPDIWANGQLAVILAVREPEYIEQAFARYGQLIAQILEENYYQRVKQNHYVGGVSSKMKNKLQKYGISFDISDSWLIDSTHQDEDFIFVHTHFPDRSLFFYKEPKPQILDDSFALAKRDSLAKKYYNGDYVLKELTLAEPIEFAGLKGIRLRGVWQNDSLVAGGPFLSYFLADQDTLYVIDGIVFNPGERKTDYLTKMEVIMNSFNLIRS
jgi:hypothetical protein